MTLQELRTFAKETIEKYPQHRKEIVGLYNLCKDEIEEGGSTEHEIELCLNEINELIKG